MLKAYSEVDMIFNVDLNYTDPVCIYMYIYIYICVCLCVCVRVCYIVYVFGLLQNKQLFSTSCKFLKRVVSSNNCYELHADF